MKYEVQPIKIGSFGPVKECIKFINGSYEQEEMVPSFVYHVRSSEHNILIDLGFSEVEKCQELTGLNCERDKSYKEILLENNIDCREIDTIICTHLHWDHAGNGKLFPNARIICQKEEISNALTSPSWASGYSQDFARDIIDVIDQFEPVEGNTEIYDGLQVIKIGGHSSGSQLVVINGKQNKIIVTGDVVMTVRNIKEEIPIGLYTNLKECVNAIKWIKSQNAVIYPGHDSNFIRL